MQAHPTDEQDFWREEYARVPGESRGKKELIMKKMQKAQEVLASSLIQSEITSNIQNTPEPLVLRFQPLTGTRGDRMVERKDVKGKAKLISSGTLIAEAQLVNISLNGVCVMSPDPIPDKKVIKLEMDVESDGAFYHIQSQAVPVYSHFSESEGYKIGLQFGPRSPEAKIALSSIVSGASISSPSIESRPATHQSDVQVEIKRTYEEVLSEVKPVLSTPPNGSIMPSNKVTKTIQKPVVIYDEFMKNLLNSSVLNKRILKELHEDSIAFHHFTKKLFKLLTPMCPSFDEEYSCAIEEILDAGLIRYQTNSNHSEFVDQMSQGIFLAGALDACVKYISKLVVRQVKGNEIQLWEVDKIDFPDLDDWISSDSESVDFSEDNIPVDDHVYAVRFLLVNRLLRFKDLKAIGRSGVDINNIA